MGKIVKTIAGGLSFAGGNVGKIAQSISLIGVGIATSDPSLIAAGISVGRSVLGGKATRNSPENVNRLRANIDPLTPRKTCIGYTAMAVDIR